MRLAATELRVEADLACGRAAQVMPELHGLVGEYPLREGLWLLLMRALEGGQPGRGAGGYGQAQEVIAGELGVDPVASCSAVRGAPGGRRGLRGPGGRPGQPDRPPPRGRGARGAGRSAQWPSPAAVPPRGAVPTAPPSLQALSVGPPPLRTQSSVTFAVGARPRAVGDASRTDPPATPRPAQLPADIGDFTGRETTSGT